MTLVVSIGYERRAPDELVDLSVLDWEIDALYFRQKTLAERSPDVVARDVVEKLRERCGPKQDLRLFLGNISTHPTVFTIVGLWSPKKKPETWQQSLFTKSFLP